MPRPLVLINRFVCCGAIAWAAGMGVGCGRRAEATANAPVVQVAPSPAVKTAFLRPETIGVAGVRTPWIAHVVAADLDRDGLVDVIACEAQTNQVLWLRQVAPGRFEEKVIASGMKAPVHAEVVDIDGDGDLDVLVASMGFVFPNNDRIGTVFILENDGHQNFTPHAVLENTERVTDVRAADCNGDGKLDLVLAQFGYDQGSVSWLERTGPWTFKRHVLLELSGAVNVGVADFNGDGRPDIVALVSQQWEEVHYFENTGTGFKGRRLWGSTNEDYGSSGMSVGDLDGDGRPDIVFTNGDGFGPAANPGPRPWHGVQWLRNEGNGKFRFQRIGDLAGAFAPVIVDWDGDGAMDVIAVAAYTGRGRYAAKEAPSVMWFRNDGRGQFEPHVLGKTPRDQITLAAGNFTGEGRVSLVSGGFFLTPITDGAGRITLWRR